MKKYIVKLVLSLFLYSMVWGNTEPYVMDCVPNSTTAFTYGAGGLNLPSIGEINVLLVFAEFKDDNYTPTDPIWVKGQAPQNMNNWIDETWSLNPTQGSLTHYFNEMSHNKLKLTGEEIHIVTNKTRAEYDSLGLKRGNIHKELLERIDVTESFESYDNWTKVSDYTHSNLPDNKIDMIFIIWRNIDFDTSIDYQVDLDLNKSRADIGIYFENNSYHNTLWVDNGARNIALWNGTGSGATINGYLNFDPFRTVVHEFVHSLLGGNVMHNGYGYWGMLSDWGTKSYNINAFELYQLQWAILSTYYTIDLTDPTVQTLTKSLGDLLTTNRAIRIKVDTDKYFYIENHQNLAYWESHTPFSANPNSIDGTIENGVYIIRQEGTSGSGRRCVPADGRHDWIAVDNIVNPYDPRKVLPVWQNYGPEKINGHHSLEYIDHNYPGCTETSSAIYFVKNPLTGVIEEPQYYMGNGTHAFRMGYNEIFSPWSNPNNQLANGSTFNFTMQLNSINGSFASITIFKNNPQDSKPFQPENLTVVWDNNHPKLTWHTNNEPDIQSYKIWKHAEGSSMIVATVTHNSSNSTHSWIDNSVSPAGKFDPMYTYSYKVNAVDNSNQESTYSNQVSINGTGDIWKINKEEQIETAITDYSVNQNYPNPFNPTTHISYQLPKNSFVNLVVYNTLGQEVAQLVNQHQSIGKYSIKFDANNLPSGVYIYKLQAGEFSSTKKMILTK